VTKTKQKVVFINELKFTLDYREKARGGRTQPNYTPTIASKENKTLFLSFKSMRRFLKKTFMKQNGFQSQRMAIKHDPLRNEKKERK